MSATEVNSHKSGYFIYYSLLKEIIYVAVKTKGAVLPSQSTGALPAASTRER